MDWLGVTRSDGEYKPWLCVEPESNPFRMSVARVATEVSPRY